MKRRSNFPEGSHNTLTVIGVKYRWTLADGTPATEPQADAIAQGHIAGERREERTTLAHYGPTRARHAWQLYAADGRRDQWFLDYDQTDRIWNGQPETAF